MGITGGWQGKLGIHANNPVERSFDFISENFVKQGANISHAGIHGFRGEQSERIRQTNYSVSGSITMQPTPEELADLLPWIFGAVASGTTFALAETLPERYVTIDRGAKVFTYDGVKVNTAVFSASEGSPLTLELGLIGKTETVGNAASFPNLTNTAAPPFMFMDTALSIAGNSEEAKSFRLTINNNLIVSNNFSQSAKYLIGGERMVGLDITSPYSSSETDLYDLAVAGVAASLTLTNGGYSLVFSLAKWQVPVQSPGISAKGSEVPLALNGIARRSGTTQELVTTLDSTA